MSLFGTDGIRDLAGQGNLAPDTLVRIGRAISTLLREQPHLFRTRSSFAPLGTGASEGRPVAIGPSTGPGVGKILIGRDTRASGLEIERRLVEGLGLETIAVGVMPTPAIAHLVRTWGCALGVAVTASHNPAEYNGVKLIDPDGLKAPDAAEAAVERLVRGTVDAAPGTGRALDFSSRAAEYVGMLKGRFGPARLDGMRLVVDCANGAASAIAPGLLRSLGAEVVACNASPDGRNINVGAGVLQPDLLAARVLRERARLGMAYDGDGDRCILVDETGAVRDGDFILAVAAEWMEGHGRLPNRTVVSTVMANFGLEKFLADRGLTLKRTSVGDRWVADEMSRSGAALGGEQSGHVIFLDALPTGDGMLTSLEILKIMAERARPLSELCAGLTKVPQTLVNVPVRLRPELSTVPSIGEAIRQAEKDLAGRGRVLVRYSGTEPLCRVMAEGTDAADVRKGVDLIVKAVREAIGE